MFGQRCLVCGLYIKKWRKAQHETWHADQVVHILKLLCPFCATYHGKSHKACETTSCRCVCNAVSP